MNAIDETDETDETNKTDKTDETERAAEVPEACSANDVYPSTDMHACVRLHTWSLLPLQT